MSDIDNESGQVEPAASPAEVAEGSEEDPIEETLYTAFMQAVATGADASQAFNVGVHSAKQVAIDHGIPEEVFERIASDLFAPYSQALNDGHPPQEALRAALQSLEG
jgi:hypothetical protein